MQNIILVAVYMNKTLSLILQLSGIRNHYGPGLSEKKFTLLEAIDKQVITGKGALKMYYETLLFLLAYPDNETLSRKASSSLKKLELYLKNHEGVAWSLFNSGITGARLCAAFSFEMVKWLRQRHKEDIALDKIEADDGQITSVLSAIMPKVESEILQDENAEWKEWLNKTGSKGEDLLDRLIRVFDQADVRPEVKDELWTALGIDITITLSQATCLLGSLTYPFYHRSLIKKREPGKEVEKKPVKIKLTPGEAGQIIDCARMVLISQLREIDPITYTAPSHVSYYRMSRGITVALFGMRQERRQPIDCYMGYMAFKNGWPIAYAGSWVLFDSARIGLNIFSAYRGGESRYIFEEVMRLHREVYHLKRFTVDPYQIGRNNSDGIQSGAFWFYHHLGFRPMKEEQKKLAEEEFLKIKTTPGYRTNSRVLNKLSRSRMELVLKGNPVRFDAVDISMVYANILRKQYGNNRKAAGEMAFNKLVKYLGLKNSIQAELNFVLKNWAVILMSDEKELSNNKKLKNALKWICELKAFGEEEDFMLELNRFPEFRRLLRNVISQNS